MKRILCLGDSNTFGYDPRSYFGGRYPKSVRWTGCLEAKGWTILNYGQNGMSIPAREAEILGWIQQIQREKPDVVIVMLGSNDLLQNPALSAEQIASRMEQFLSALTEQYPANHILLVAPPPMRTGEWVTDQRLLTESARIGTCYQAVAKRIGSAFANAGEWEIDLAFDGVHFLPSGHRAFAEGISADLQKIEQEQS